MSFNKLEVGKEAVIDEIMERPNSNHNLILELI